MHINENKETYEKDGIVYPTGCKEVLDKGFVKLVDFMGDDSSIVQAARVSYGKGTKKVNEDRGLIRYLMKHAHTSPFEMCELKFHCKMPIFVARQWVRHRTAAINEYSARYSEVKDEFYIPELDRVQLQSKDNKQGSGLQANRQIQQSFVNDCIDSQQVAAETYKEYNELGVAKELNRINMPVSNYTEWYWKINLHNFFHFCRLRLDPHAQYEIRVFAQAMYDLVKEHYPIACEAFEDYSLNAVKFSKQEMSIIKYLASLKGEEFLKDALTTEGLSQREVEEFIKKIRS